MNKENSTKSIDLVLNELKKSSFANRFSCTVEVNHIWNAKQAFEKKVTRTIGCNVPPPITQETGQETIAIQQRINEAYKADKETHEILNEINYQNQLKKGDALPHFNEKLTDVFLASPVEIKHQAGEVILLDIWATWCGPCQNPMQHNQEMLEKNGATWGDKVRIIAVSVDSDMNKLKERIEDKKWDKIVHYTTRGWDHDNALLYDFEVGSIPFVALINKQGIIDFVGNPSDVDLESRINELLAFGEAVSSKSGDKRKPTSELSQEQAKKFKNVVGKELKAFVETSKEPKDFEIDFSLTLKKIVTYTVTGKHAVYAAEFKSVVQKQQMVNYEILKKKLYSLLGEDIIFKKTAEKILDVQRSLKNDIKELAGIISKEAGKSAEFEHLVEIKLRLQESFEFIKAREDHLLHFSKILIEPTEEAKQQVATATQKCRQFIKEKYQKGEYSDYMIKQFYRGVQFTEKAEDITAPIPRVNEDVYRQVKEVFQDASLLLKEKFESTQNYCPCLKVVLKRHRVFDSQGNVKEKFYEQPILSYEVKDVDLVTFRKDVVEKILDRIGRNLFVVKEKTIKTETVPLGTNCKLCEAVLELPHYYNPFQKEHYCLPCGNKRDETKNTIDSFNVPHNLVFIPSAEPKYLSEIESYKFGKDTQPAPEKEMQFQFKFSCSSCSRGSTVGRYVCLNCKPGRLQKNGYFDLCHECFDKSSIKKDEEFNKNLKTEHKDHHENHLFFKLITSEGGYSDF